MTWFTVIVILIVAVVAVVATSVFSFFMGVNWAIKTFDLKVKKEADKMVDKLLKQKIGKTLAGVNDGKRYSWKVHFDNDGERKCSTMRFGVDDSLADIVNMINRRAIEWGCDITHIEVKRCDVVD